LTRDLAQRFNRDYGETFRLPEVFIPKVGAKIAALDDPSKKMSKSEENDNSRINMLDEPDTVRRKFRRAVTDSGSEIRFDESRPGVTNLLSVYQIMTGRAPAEIESHFEGKGYGKLKEEVAEATVEYLRPFRERVLAITDEELNRVLADGRDRARSIAGETLRRVYERLGIVGA
ncbi:MAG TPA: tryptophan--tRNA ligase, partial [Pyrinomonadaceae bacterium]